MEKWEHCRLSVVNDKDVYVLYYRANGQPEMKGQTGFARTDGPDMLPSIIGELGQDGWQLVNVLVDPNPQVSDRLNMFFKRRIV